MEKQSLVWFEDLKIGDVNIVGGKNAYNIFKNRSYIE